MTCNMSNKIILSFFVQLYNDTYLLHQAVVGTNDGYVKI